jgi:hypothetical protein
VRIRPVSPWPIVALLALSACERPAPATKADSPRSPTGAEGQGEGAPREGTSTSTPTPAPAPAPAPAPTSTSTETSTETSTPTPTPPPPPAPPVELVEAQALIPGAATPLKTGEQITVDPGATFRVVLKGTYPEARLSLLDGADGMLPSAGAREAGPATTVTLQPAAPLKPGTSYRLRVDGATTRELKAADGTVRGPVDLPILAAGEPPQEPKAKAKKPKKRP